LIVPVAYALFDDATQFFKERFPMGMRERRVWAFAMAGGAGALFAWVLVQLAGVLAPLPEEVANVASLLAKAGLLVFALGVAFYLIFGRRRARLAAEARARATPPVDEAA
jgi:hypothetical protein